MPLFCHRITELIYKYQREELTEEERVELHLYIDQSDERKQMFNNLDDFGYVSAGLHTMSQVNVQAKWENFARLHPFENRSAIWWKLAAAACVVLLLAIGASYLFAPAKRTQPTQPIVNNKPAIVKDSVPGQLTRLQLNDGRIIAVDSMPNGLIAIEGPVEIIKQDTLLKYNLILDDSLMQPGDYYNICSTPANGRYQVRLVDSSHISLNAGSSIRFPLIFPRNKRQVEITGEALFDVTKNGSPFIVLVPDEQDSIPGTKRKYKAAIEVLGTSFNVNAYKEDDAVRATLLSGSIKVSAGRAGKIIKPGQQATINKNGQIRILTLTGTQTLKNIMAWRNGVFAFDDDIKTIMKQLARYYSLRVEYKGAVSGENVILECSQSLPFEQVLKMLETSGFHFEIHDHHVTVL